MLFVELVLIRWAGAYVIYLSYFANFILLGSFLGIGVGFLRARREPDLFRLAPLLLVLFVGVVKALPVKIDRTGGDLVYFGVQTHGLPTWVMLPFIFLATAAVMASIAHGVAARFSRLPALDAYRADIIGSICGIAVFSLLALLGAGPIAWGLVVVALFVVLLRRPSVIQVVALAGLLVVFAAGTFRSGTIWSPYYRLEVTHDGDETAIDANGVPHQTAIVTTGSDYEDIYERLAHPPARVLVVGAGNGNDVAVALEHGATHVDAVEIDPEIQKIGAQFHPQHPYQDPRVTRIIADGRAYLERAHGAVRPHHLRAAGLADARRGAVGDPAGELPVHAPGVPGGPRPAGARRRVRDLQLLPRAVAGGSPRGHDGRRVRPAAVPGPGRGPRRLGRAAQHLHRQRGRLGPRLRHPVGSGRPAGDRAGRRRSARSPT